MMYEWILYTGRSVITMLARMRVPYYYYTISVRVDQPDILFCGP